MGSVGRVGQVSVWQGMVGWGRVGEVQYERLGKLGQSRVVTVG